MSAKPTVATISAAVAVFCGGCERNREQPWRKALDEGNVIRLGGTVGKLSPSPPPTEAPLFPPPVVVQPKPGTTSPDKKPTVEDFPLPPPPKATEKKTAPAIDDEPKLGPPR